MAPALRPLRGLYPVGIAARTAAPRAGRPTSGNPPTTPTTPNPDRMLFDLRGAGRRRTVKVIYITLAFLMGGGLVLFGIGGDVTRRPGRRHHGGSGGGDDRRGPLQKQEKAALAQHEGQPAGRGRVGRARPRALPARGHRRELRPEKGTFTKAGQAELAAAGAAWERYLALEPKQARRPRREPDGPGLRRRSTIPRRRSTPRRSSPTPARPPRPTPSSRSSPTRPARPARATSPRTRRSSSPSPTCARP